MNFTQELENQINTSLIILAVKIRAFKSVLTEEQLERYNETIDVEKPKLQTVLLKILTPEQVDEVLKELDK